MPQQLPILRETNRIIREFAGETPELATTWTFICECGCFGLVDLTLEEFDAAPHVLAPGHTVPAALLQGNPGADTAGPTRR
ncbi:MAG TPA: hypothetical protein VFA56_11000 [Gaiellaceae bacterium]|nr:hypothetical protein [Gaiellaceae bacterium]